MLIILVSFPLGRCVDNIVNNRANYQFTSVIVKNFMNGIGVCWIIGKTVFNVYVCLNPSQRYKHYQIERRDEKPRHQRQFLQNQCFSYTAAKVPYLWLLLNILYQNGIAIVLKTEYLPLFRDQNLFCDKIFFNIFQVCIFILSKNH